MAGKFHPARSAYIAPFQHIDRERTGLETWRHSEHPTATLEIFQFDRKQLIRAGIVLFFFPRKKRLEFDADLLAITCAFGEKLQLALKGLFVGATAHEQDPVRQMGAHPLGIKAPYCYSTFGPRWNQLLVKRQRILGATQLFLGGTQCGFQAATSTFLYKQLPLQNDCRSPRFINTFLEARAFAFHDSQLGVGGLEGRPFKTKMRNQPTDQHATSQERHTGCEPQPD